MKTHFTSFLLALFVLSYPTQAFSQINSNQENLIQRIEKLEQTVAQLKQRIIQLEREISLSKTNNEPLISNGNWRNQENWRQLKIGMTQKEVKRLLGVPDKVDVGSLFIYWYYGYPSGGSVHFDTDTRRLNGWSEP